MLESASCIFFHVDNFLHVSPLKQCHWLFTRLWQSVSCGLDNPPGGGNLDCRWIITNIIDTSNQSVSLRDMKRKKRPNRYLIQPNTSIIFTYSSYRIVICLEINRAIYSIRSDGGTAADEMVNSLITMLEEMCKTLQTQDQISRVYVTVIAHHSEINMTYGIWQTEITNQNSSSPPSSFFSMFSKKLEDLTFQRQVNPCVLGGGDSKQWSGFEGMNMNSIVEGILFYLNILPAESCPIAVLISPGVVEVPVASITKSFAKANIPFHVLLVTLTSDTQPLGCVPEIDNLRVLAEASGGSFETVSSVTKQNLESIGQIFLRPFYACRSENYHLREYSSLLRRDAGLKLYESRLQGYQLQGLTLEHIVASRLTEGYTIIGIIAETTQNQTSTFLGTGKTCLHIKLEKHLTKVSSITYIVSFYTDKTPKDYLVRKPKGDVGISRYGTGILSIEILCKCPQRIFKDVHEESATTNILINESRAIFDYDNRISLILKIPGMPGYIPPFLSEEVENGLHQNGNTIQDVSSRQSLIFNQFLVSSDILENLCSMNHYQEGYLYLMSFSPGIALDNEKRSKLFHNLRSISPHIKLYSLSGMKWLCFSNMLSKESPHEIEIYDLYLIEIDHLEPNFLTVRFSSFGNSPRGSCDLTLETVLLNIQATLHTLQFHSIRLNRNLSLLSTALSCSSRHNQLIYCYLDPIFKFYEINLFTNRQLLQSYLSDFKNNKMCLGFQPTYTSLGSMESKIHFSCILSASPSGLQVDSLFQCCVECSNEGVFISYFLEPSYEANLHPHDPFQLTRILDIPLGQSTDLAIENLSVQLPNHEISNLLQSLLRQDTLLFDYYFAMTSVYYYRIQNSLDSLMKNPRSIKIQANYWSCLQSYSYSRKFFLPALSICDDLEPSDLDATKLNNKLVELLHISLHDLNLTHIHIIGKELLSFHADYIFCQSFESGLMIIEINSKGNDVPKSEIGTRTPTLDTKNIKPELEVLASIEASSSATTDDDDCKTPDNSDTVRTTPVIGILKRFDSQEIIDELDFDTKLQDPIENSISIHYRFVSIPLQVFSSHSQTSEIVRSFQIAPEGFASLNNSLIENPLYNQYFLDMNQQLQKYHGVNFSRIIYTNLRFNFCGKIQMSDLLRALSYCQTDTIEMEVEISYRLKKYVTNGFTDLTSAINLQLYPLTLGKYLQPILHGDYFLFVPTADRDFGIFFDNELQIYNYGIFVKIFLTHKNPLRNINKEIEIFCRDINLNNFFTDIFMEYYLLCGEDKLGDLFYTSSSDDNINIKLEIFSAGFELGTNENLRHILNTFTCELESLINYDTLSTLLILPNVSRENIVLVQHCLRSARNLCQSTYSLDFLTPPSGQGILYAEKVSQCFEEELVLLKEFEKIGDIIYARSWILHDNSQEIPCWILMTISQTTLLDGEGLVDNMQIISMEVSVILFVIGEHQSKKDTIMEQIHNKLKVCCHRVNQKNLLRDLNSTRLASSYLIKTTIETDTSPAVGSGTSLTRANRLQQMKNKDVIPTFVFPDTVSSVNPCIHRSSFTGGCFECGTQGRIDLLLPADVSNVLNNSLSHHHIVTMLESTALHPFLISNVRKCFVYQHKNGDIYYMAFAPPNEDNNRIVSLVVYGVTELNINIKTELKKVLEVKLTEYIANIISITMVPRRTVLPTTHVQFLRDCGLSKRVEFVYHLPSFVSDPYFFCVLAKQLFSKSEIFMALTIQYNDRQEHLSSYLHPAMYGYDDSRQNSEITLGNSEISSSMGGKMIHQTIVRPHLERKKQVDKELCSEQVVHPIFFDRKRQLQTPRNDKRHDSSMIIWDQGDFTLLYNSHDKEKSKRNISQKRAFTQAGGLALIEFQPISEQELSSIPPLDSASTTPTPSSTTSSKGNFQPLIFTTGTEELLINDVNKLVEHLKLHEDIQLEAAKLREPTSSTSGRSLSSSPDHLIIRIYPTRGINPKTLMEGLHSFFNQTLIYYSLERLFSVYNNQTTPRQQLFVPSENESTIESQSPLKQELYPFSTNPTALDLFRSYQKLILGNSSDLLPYISHLIVPIRLSLTDAEYLHHRILSFIISQFPHLINMTILPASLQITKTDENCVSWFEQQEDLSGEPGNATTKYSSCSCILGENFITFDGNKHSKEVYKWKGSSKDGHFVYHSPENYSLEVVNALRHLPDYVPDKSLLFPLWLRKRRYSIEVTITSSGIHLLFFNIEKKHIDNMKSIIHEYSNDMIQKIHKKQLKYIEKINFITLVNNSIQSSPTATSTSKLDASHISMETKNDLLQRLSVQIQGLFWSQRVLSRLYVYSSRGLVTNPSGNLSTLVALQSELRDIPFKIWSEGILLRRTYVPLPNYHLLPDSSHVLNVIEEYSQHLSHLSRSFDCYYLEESDSHQIFLLFPIAHTSSLYIIQLNCFSSLYLGITHRIADCSDIIRSIIREYQITDPNSILTPETKTYLTSPSIGSPINEKDENINIMNFIYNHSIIKKLNLTVLYSMLSSLYFKNFQNIQSQINGSRVLSIIKMINESIPEDIYMEVFQIPLSWFPQRNSLLATLCGTPTDHDILHMYNQSPLNNRIDCLSYEPSSDKKFAFFRYLSSSNSSSYSPYLGKNSQTPIRRLSDYNDTISIVQRSQRKTHGIYGNAILGIVILEINPNYVVNEASPMTPAPSTPSPPTPATPAPMSSFQLTICLFPGDKIIGNEKELILNNELEEKMNKQLHRLRFIHSNDLTQILIKIKKDIRHSGNLAYKLIYTQKAWDILYNSSIKFQSTNPILVNDSHDRLLQALLFHANILPLTFLNFIIPSLMKLIQCPDSQQLFIGICQRVFQHRFTYLRTCHTTSTTSLPDTSGDIGSTSEAIPSSYFSLEEYNQKKDLEKNKKSLNYDEHYFITGIVNTAPTTSTSTPTPPLSTLRGNYLIDIYIQNQTNCSIRLIEYRRNYTNEEKYQQQRIVEHLLDVILYAVSVVCEDEIKLIASST